MTEQIKKILGSKKLQSVFIVAFAVFFSVILYRNRSIMAALSLNDLGYFSVIVGLTVMSVFFRGLINIVSFHFGGKIGLLDGYKLAAVNTIGNYVSFSGGLLAKGVFLKNKFNVRYLHYAAVSVYILITGIAVSGAVGLGSTLIIRADNWILFLGFGAMMLSGVFLFVPVPNFGIFSKLFPVDDLSESRLFFRPVVSRILLLNLVLVVLFAMRLSYSFLILLQQSPFVNLLLLTSGSILTRLIALTPGSIGIREGVIGTLAYLTGMDYQLAIIAVGIDRLAEILVVFITYGAIYLIEKVRPRAKKEST